MCETVNKIIGVYILKSPVSDKCYVGSSINCCKRFGEHFASLKRGKHKNNILQKAYNKHGILEPYIVWEITEKVYKKHPWKLREQEEDFIDDFNSSYNCTDNTFCPPKDEKVCKKN